MKKTFVIMGILLVCAFIASATEMPQYEAYAGYDFARFNPNHTGYIPSFNANGGSGQFIWNYNRWLSGVFDAGAVTKGTLNGFNINTTIANFVAGPRFNWRRHSRYVPFVEALFGGYYATASARVFVDSDNLLPSANPNDVPPSLIASSGIPVTTRVVASRTGFAMLVGGGLDIKLNRHIAFRPVEADYYLTRLPDIYANNLLVPRSNSNLNNFRYSGGVVFMFGAR